jgi:hypothetical protein
MQQPTCPVCGKDIEQLGRGRPRKYCGRACRGEANRGVRFGVRTCAQCQVEFVPRIAGQRTCSNRCAANLRSPWPRSRECGSCGESFEVSRVDAGRKYCKPECAIAGCRRTKGLPPSQKSACEVCGKEYKSSHSGGRSGRTRTCSRKCGVKIQDWVKIRASATERAARRASVRAPKLPRACRDCGAEIGPRALLCDPCRDTAKRARYKSDALKRKRAEPAPTRICAECGVEFKARNRQHAYCSRACSKKAEKRRNGDDYRRPIPMAKLFERYGYRCWICRRKVDPAKKYPNWMCPSVDHVIPRSAGGGDEIENLRPAHWRCNTQRRAGREGEQLPLAV